MTLAILMKKGGLRELATAIPAIPAIPKSQDTGSVARIATIAVATPPAQKTANEESPPLLAPEDQAVVLGWLDAIGEDDEAMRREVLSKCRSDSKALAYVLAQANPINARQAET